MKIKFPKGYNSLTNILTLLQNRGLIINHRVKALNQLKNIGYYRFSAYLYPLLDIPKEHQTFKCHANFDTALSLYNFDTELRQLLFNYIAPIEIAFRSTLANTVADITSNPFWITTSSMFANSNLFNKTIEIIDTELNHSREDFIVHFKNKYSDPYPPAWMLTEILPVGTLNHIFNNIADNRLKKTIAKRFMLPLPVFSSWITTFILTRNACCHHSRIWNKENAIIPKALNPQKSKLKWINNNFSLNKIYYNICIIKFLMDQLEPSNDFNIKLKDILSTYPMVDVCAMGFPIDWQNEPLWQ